MDSKFCYYYRCCCTASVSWATKQTVSNIYYSQVIVVAGKSLTMYHLLKLLFALDDVAMLFSTSGQVS